MPQEGVVIFPPGSAKKLVSEGVMKIVTSPETSTHKSTLEQAKKIFGKEFIGENEIRKMEETCKAMGINVQFLTDDIPFSYTPQQLVEVGKEIGTDRERFCVLRPKEVKLTDSKGSYDGPITISILKRLFKDIRFFGEGLLVFDNSWYRDEDFINQPLKCGYAMPVKHVLEESENKTWKEQEKLLKPGERRREAVEALWDTIAYYVVRKEQLLKDSWDWTKTSDSFGTQVAIGKFNSLGVRVHYSLPERIGPNLGLCPTR